MTIKEVLGAIAEFTSYARTGNGGRWLLINGGHGPVPVFAPEREDWAKVGRVFGVLQLLTVGWEEAHDSGLWNVKPDKETIMEALELSEKHYEMIQAAAYCRKPYNARLRADLLAACELEELG